MKKVSNRKPPFDIVVGYGVWLAFRWWAITILVIIAVGIIVNPLFLILAVGTLFFIPVAGFVGDEIPDKHHIPYEACYCSRGMTIYVSNGFVWIPTGSKVTRLDIWIERKLELQQKMKQESESEKETVIV